MKIQHLAAVTVLSLCLAAAGCQQSNSGGASAGSGGSVGAGSKKLPEGARKIAEARGTRVIHRTLREGTVYVVDSSDGNKVIFSGEVAANANVVVDPKANVVAINDTEKQVKDKLDAGHKYAIYFVQQ
jgi:hypothetical protein